MMTTREAAESILLSDGQFGRELREWALKAYVSRLAQGLAPGDCGDQEEHRKLAADMKFENDNGLRIGTLQYLREVDPEESPKIARIKIVRNNSGLALKESKEMVEAIERLGIL